MRIAGWAGRVVEDLSSQHAHLDSLGGFFASRWLVDLVWHAVRTVGGISASRWLVDLVWHAVRTVGGISASWWHPDLVWYAVRTVGGLRTWSLSPTILGFWQLVAYFCQLVGGFLCQLVDGGL